MIKILLSGACGKMGRMVTACVSDDNECEIICGVAQTDTSLGFPVYSSFEKVKEKPDIIVDFSHTSVLDGLLEYAVKNRIPAVLATTGYSSGQIENIRNTAKQIPIFFTANMSLGVNLLCSLAKKAVSVLGNGFDIEILEKHHNQKIDAPSGTALMLADAINGESGEIYHYEYDRHSKRQKRTKSEIGIHSVRGGTIVGEHDIIFAGRDEVITLSHSAASKEVFATGAIKAVKFLYGKEAGLYDMGNILDI